MQQTAINNRNNQQPNILQSLRQGLWSHTSKFQSAILPVTEIFGISHCQTFVAAMRLPLANLTNLANGERDTERWSVMETEWKAKTGRVSLLTRSAATVRLAYSVSRSVKKLESWLQLITKSSSATCQDNGGLSSRPLCIIRYHPVTKLSFI